LRAGLINLGLFASGGASPLDLNGGALTAQTATLSGLTAGSVPFAGTAGLISQDNANLFFDNTNNRLGVGTAVPRDVLHVFVASGGMLAENIAADGTAFQNIVQKARGSVGAETAVQSGDVLMNFVARGYDGDGTYSAYASNSAVFRVVATATHSATDHGARIDFRTVAAGVTTVTTRAVIEEKGLTLGTAVAARGTTNPTNALTLVDGTAPAGTLTNAVQLYSASGELLAMDSGGNVSNLTLPFTSSTQGVVPASGGTSTQKFLTQNVTFASPIYTKAITVETPTATEDVSLFWTDDAITITKIVAVLVGSSTPSVTWTVRHGSDRSAAGTEVVTGGTVTTSITTGSVVTSFNDATVVADAFLWLETTAQSGTVTSLNVTIHYTID
jgi:hypothetical protein